MQQGSVEQGRLGGAMRVMSSSHRHGVDEFVTEPADVQNYEGLAIAWEVSKNPANLKKHYRPLMAGLNRFCIIPVEGSNRDPQ